MENKILGRWKLDPEDTISLNLYGDVSIEFKENGEMIYATYADGKTKKMFLTYTINENFIITDQKSSPSKEETMFKISPSGKLNLYFNKVETTFIKVADQYNP